ncbi:ubiquitin carboxyl-terminal hydrolase 30-like isoform X1 [Myxocyprinus asiaticus]|uniref:ubiquitin carboxyl-terminal hydrolase 30-like isoform X1 n=2 Tax=Myxocyprinus asiaticus TaxID=70543 RepID=UPI002222C90D|nr:ubiquitin carboxyl-terminal hydrolase 30-like isoform X1 [Myxocyprinus asiaticus]
MPWCKQGTTDKLVREFLRTGSAARNKMSKNWSVIGGVAAAMVAGVYVLWGPISDRKKKRKGMVPGLLNLGNTCFMNSLLQGLAACPSFIRWLEDFTSESSTHPERTERDTQLSRSLMQLIKALSSQDHGEDDILDAGCLLEALGLYRWHISSFEEQDAHELFHVLTSSLEEERERQTRVTHLFDMHTLEKSVESNEKNISCRSGGPSHPIPSLWRTRHPFHGRLTSYMACKRCEQQNPVHYDSFDSLSLSIPSVQWGRPVTLDQCLQHFISSETIKEVECENCTKQQAGALVNGQESQRTTFVKQLKLGKLPQCLCIHLQRLTWSKEGTPIKRQEHVQFTEYLSMDRYKHCTAGQNLQRTSRTNKLESEVKAVGDPKDKPIANGVDPEHCNNNKTLSNGTLSSVFLHSSGLSSQLNLTYNYSASEYLFRLMAVLVHHGDMHSGHFITYRRCPAARNGTSPFSSQWLWVSDDSVRKASLQEALSSSAYLLFYERVQRPGLR